jgi:hypothetical protein
MQFLGGTASMYLAAVKMCRQIVWQTRSLHVAMQLHATGHNTLCRLLSQKQRGVLSLLLLLCACLCHNRRGDCWCAYCCLLLRAAVACDISRGSRAQVPHQHPQQLYMPLLCTCLCHLVATPIAVSAAACCHLQWRVIFDEGHVLKCRTTIQAKAACSLASDRRWVVTGTPIDTDVTDVYGLLLGLQVGQANKNKTTQEPTDHQQKTYKDMKQRKEHRVHEHVAWMGH